MILRFLLFFFVITCHVSAQSDELFSKATPIPQITLQTAPTAPATETAIVSSASLEEDERAISLTGIGLIFDADGSQASIGILETYYSIIQSKGINPSVVLAIMKDIQDENIRQQLADVMESKLNQGEPKEDPKLEDNPELAFSMAQQIMNETLSSDQFQRKVAAALSLVPLPMVPPAYNWLKKFPTWILFTKDGQIILEGLKDPSPYLTKSGKFVEPIGASEVLAN